MGPMSMRTALAAYHKNTPAVQALQQVGLDKAKDFAINLGIPLKEIYESYAIGGFGGKTMGFPHLKWLVPIVHLEITGFIQNHMRLEKLSCGMVPLLDTCTRTKVVMKDSTAFMITDMLKSVIVSPGTGTRAKVPGLPIAGKTGTTNYTDEEMTKMEYYRAADRFLMHGLPDIQPIILHLFGQVIKTEVHLFNAVEIIKV